MADLKYSEVASFLQKVWNENAKTLDRKEQDFMKAMKDIMFWLVTDADPHTNPMDSAYDSTCLLDAFSRAIDQYKEIYHIANVSMQWSEADDKDDE